MDISFHYPPELFKLLNEAIPRLCKSKQDLLLFFQGAGVSKTEIQPYEAMLRTDKDSFKKHVVSTALLKKLNELGERSLKERREILKRVTEWDDFSVCWPQDQAAARGYVSQIRELVNVKDSFTRMKMEKEEESRKHQKQKEIELNKTREENIKREKVKADLASLFGEKDAHKRGKLLEKVLNEIFECFGISVRESFVVKGNCGEGVIEQIDGLVELEGVLYFVEMKWWSSPIGAGEIAPHLVRVFSRGGQVRGLFISYTDFTEPAITHCREAISQGKVVVLSMLEEIVFLLNDNRDLKKWLKEKFNAAIVDKQPYVKR